MRQLLSTPHSCLFRKVALSYRRPCVPALPALLVHTARTVPEHFPPHPDAQRAPKSENARTTTRRCPDGTDYRRPCRENKTPLHPLEAVTRGRCELGEPSPAARKLAARLFGLSRTRHSAHSKVVQLLALWQRWEQHSAVRLSSHAPSSIARAPLPSFRVPFVRAPDGPLAAMARTCLRCHRRPPLHGLCP